MKFEPYRGTSSIRRRTPLGPYRKSVPRVLGESIGVGVFLWARYPCANPFEPYPFSCHWVALDPKEVAGPFKHPFGVADQSRRK